MTHIATVTADLELRLVVPGGPSLPVMAGLRYDSVDPWAVRVAFETGGEGDGVVEWLFARQLLTDGIAGACGEGDVRVWPALHGNEQTLFDKFTRGQAESATPGVGLGLAICKAVVSAHGGDIAAMNAVTDAEGGGAEFTVTLPRRAPPALPELPSS